MNDGKIFVRFISDEELEYTQDGVWRVLRPTELGLRWNSPMLDLHHNGEAAASQALVDAFSMVVCAYYSNKNATDKAID